ncbi:hypothetical protein ACFQ3S_18310 [Mucilaginibacter terrae]
MINIRVEEVGDIHAEYPYLEVFSDNSNVPFLEIGITAEQSLLFKLYNVSTNTFLTHEEWSHLLTIADDFLYRTLKNENNFLNSNLE